LGFVVRRASGAGAFLRLVARVGEHGELPWVIARKWLIPIAFDGRRGANPKLAARAGFGLMRIVTARG
jgi:hypothetical protein